MTMSPSAILHRLRARPLHERRILAIASYLSATAVIGALWVTSLQDTLHRATARPGSSAESSMPPPAGRASLPLAPSSAPVPPLRALGQAARTFVKDVSGLGEDISELGRRAAELKTPGTPPELPEYAPPEPATIPPPSTLARLLTSELKPKPYSAYAMARLLSAPPNAPAAAAPPTEGGSRFTAIITYNLGEIRRTAVDVYRFFTR